jgi:putative transposase
MIGVRAIKKRFTDAQIVGFLREADAGLPAKDLCRKHGFSESSYDPWRSQFGGMSGSDAKRLKELEPENGRSKQLYADSLLEKEVTREVLRQRMVTAPVRREVLRAVIARRLSERRALAVVRLSASSLRYVPRPLRMPHSEPASSRTL